MMTVEDPTNATDARPNTVLLCFELRSFDVRVNFRSFQFEARFIDGKMAIK